MDYFAGQAVYEVCSGSKGFILKFEGHGSMGQKGEAYLHYMTVFSFGHTVLLMSMGTGHMMSYANTLEKRI